MVRSPAPIDIFTAISDPHRREILDALVGGEMPVGAIVEELAISQPQVSKHLRLLSQAGLVRCRAMGRHRLYRLDPACLRPLQEWTSKYEVMMNKRLDRLEDYLTEIQRDHGTAADKTQGES